MSKYDMQLYINIGKTLKKARELKNMSLDSLSNAIGEIKTKSTLKRYEDGTSRIEMSVLEKICGILGLDYQEVIKNAKYESIQNIESANNSQWGDDKANRKYFAEKPELLSIYEEIFNREDMVILFDKTKDLTPADVESVLMFVQMIRKQRDLD